MSPGQITFRALNDIIDRKESFKKKRGKRKENTTDGKAKNITTSETINELPAKFSNLS